MTKDSKNAGYGIIEDGDFMLIFTKYSSKQNETSQGEFVGKPCPGTSCYYLQHKKDFYISLYPKFNLKKKSE